MQRFIRTVDDVLAMLDELFAADDQRRQPWADGMRRWDGFYADRDRDIPFFVPEPVENLASYICSGRTRILTPVAESGKA